MQPNPIRAKNFKKNARKAQSKQNEGIFRRIMPIDLNVPSWTREFMNIIFVIKAAYDIDEIIDANIAAEVEAKEMEE